MNGSDSQFVWQVQDEFLRQPKAVLQQHCQKNGWAAPKYEKLSTLGKLYAYTVTVTRPTVGRGKNKIVGGPVLCKLPEKEDYFESISVSTNQISISYVRESKIECMLLSSLVNIHCDLQYHSDLELFFHTWQGRSSGTVASLQPSYLRTIVFLAEIEFVFFRLGSFMAK